MQGEETYPLLEGLMNGVESILDRDTLEVTGRYLEPQWEVKINLLDWWCSEQLFQDLLVVYCGRRRVYLPTEWGTCVSTLFCTEGRGERIGNDVPSRLLSLLGDIELNPLSLCRNSRVSRVVFRMTPIGAGRDAYRDH